ncbi:monovalent cation:proton antiporter-2 (CPA2) family protein [Nitrosomonas sp. Nm34]|uniref:monovalent cation:proton antiporter-2 (CPA2) family protein n=1 Tax=Nitrosomonas sp. Nm34 TaxID=1881055 RepID=UPI000B882F32|nr:monovalent cation:proton antiporter-2 (CPA2) family protein [Nitrosomonas sp. Nm34]
MNTSILFQMVLFLASAVIIVPLSKRLGLGTVIGFLVAGGLIGPWGLRLVADVDEMLHLSELGVVLLLFIIGLELQPSRLWALRRRVFLLGSAQVFGTGVVLALGGHLLGLPITTAVIAGLVLSFSSTAFALQLLAERKQLTTHFGRMSFVILLFQDLVAIPLLAIVPLLADGTSIDQADGFAAVGIAIGVILAVVMGGRLLLRPALRFVAGTASQEIFTAAALLIVMGTALLLQFAGLSMALGAFLAGVLLADSEYRHELEADIEPFKGLLLGLFFMSVGMSLDLGLITNQPLTIVGLTLGLITVKAVLLYAIGRLSGQDNSSAVNMALAISQGGEFAFVVFAAAGAAGLMDTATVNQLVVVVSLSLVATPLLIFINDLVFHFGKTGGPAREFDRIEMSENRVIIAGFGRFGQIVARNLRIRKISFTALESSFEQVDFVRSLGNKIYFGDASRLDLLRAAKADKAEVFVLAIDDIAASIKTVEIVRQYFPHLKIYARARNRQHVYHLMDAGVEYIFRETFASSLEMADSVLQGLGISPQQAHETVRRFRAHDETILRKLHLVHHDEKQLIATEKQAAAQLEELFEHDANVAEGRDRTTANMP